MTRAPRAYTLTDLLVTIAIIAIVLAVVVQVLSTQRCGAPRRTQCINNARQLGLSLISFDSAMNRLPNSGTWASELDVTGTRTGGAAYPTGPDDPDVNDIRWDFPLHNWVVDILPFMERADIADQWKATQCRNDHSSQLALFDEPDRSARTPIWDKKGSITHYSLSQTYLPLLVCPDDDSIQDDRGNLSYAVNGGPVLLWQQPMNNSATPALLRLAGDTPESDADHHSLGAQKLGLLYPGSLLGNTPWDVKRTLSRIPDGTSTTILLGENLRSGYIASYPHSSHNPKLLWYDAQHEGRPGAGRAEGTWANPDPNFSAFRMSDDFCAPSGDCQTGSSESLPIDGTVRTVTRADWTRANSRESRDNLLGDPESINGSFASEEGWPYLSSYHLGGAVVVMCDGSTRFLSQEIDGSVFAKLVSPAGNRTMRQHWPVFQSALQEGY